MTVGKHNLIRYRNGRTPDDEDGLENKVHGDPVENGSDSHGLSEVEAAKDGPVGEPLLVVVGAGRLDGLDGEVGRERPADQVGDGRREAEHVEEDEHDRARAQGEHTVRLGNLGLLLDLPQDRVLVQLSPVN